MSGTTRRHCLNSAGKKSGILYVSWAEHCSRSDFTASALEGESRMVYCSKLGSRASTVLLKYTLQAFRTWRLLRKESPSAVFVMSPPVFAALPVFVYCKLKSIPYVIDAHSGAFLNPRWKYFQWLQNAMCRRAATTIVTNEHLAGELRKVGAHASILADVPIVYGGNQEYQLDYPFNVAAVCSFNHDEPVEEVFEAARKLSDVGFYVTGNPASLRSELRENCPANLRLTGFLSSAQYGALLRKADAVLTLTTMNHTMLRGAYEAIYNGTPVILSEGDLLRQEFPIAAVLVKNESDSICAAIRVIQSRSDKFREEVRQLRQEKLNRFRRSISKILEQTGLGVVQKSR